MNHNNKEIREKYRLEQEIKDNPDWCYCYELLVLEPDINEDEPIGETEPIDGYPCTECKGYTQKIYICKRCGKKTTISIVVA